MTDTTTITQEERHSWRERLTSEFSCFNAELGGFTLRILDALEAVEAENVNLNDDLDTANKSLKEYEGFFEELCTRLRQRFPEQYAEIECDEYGGDAFGVHELFEFVIDPVINSAREQAEAIVARLLQRVYELLSEELTDGAVRERIQLRGNMHEVLQKNERLTKMVDWLASHTADICASVYQDSYDLHWWTDCEWKEAAREAVAAGEETCQK